MMKQRRRRDQRRDNPAPMRLEARDIDVIEAVYKCRVLKQDQIQALYFGSRATAQTRLEKLYDHGYLERKFLPVLEGEGRSPTLYVLDRKGAETLRRERGYDEINWYASSKDLKTDFLEHTLAINTVMIAVTLACRAQGYTLDQWKTESDLKADYDRVHISQAGKRESAPVIPDSYFMIIANERRYSFFLELDRGTMELKRFKTKVKAYLAYYQSGGYLRRYGLTGLRVLTVVSTLSERGGEGRREHLKQATEAAGGTTLFWFGVLLQLTPEAFFTAPVWQRARDQEQKVLELST